MSKRKRSRLVESPVCIDGSDSESDSATGSSGRDDFGAAICNQSKKLDTKTFEHYLGILLKSFSKDKKASFIFLDSLWFSLYMQKPNKEKVLKWIKQKHILKKNYVVIPIVCWSHWNLLVLCHPGASSKSKARTRCMLLLDSLHMADPRRFEPDIRKFVMDIYEAENKPEEKAMISKIPFLVPKVPQQRNAEECGHFVLYFLKLFVQSAPKKFTLDSYPYSMKEDWFSYEDVDHFCSELSQCSQ